MIKQVLTAASFALGGTGVILVGYLSSNPLAFTQPVGNLAISTPIARSLVDTPVGIDLGAPLMLPEVTISGSPRRATRAAVADRLDPCSEYRDVGATYIEQQGATGVRRVRSLCASDANP